VVGHAETQKVSAVRASFKRRIIVDGPQAASTVNYEKNRR
jgi:hypothetical protein